MATKGNSILEKMIKEWEKSSDEEGIRLVGILELGTGSSMETI